MVRRVLSAPGKEFCMQTLKKAHEELFRRNPDERFKTFDDLWAHCLEDRERSTVDWVQPGNLTPSPREGRLDLSFGQDDNYRLNSWSFGQLCSVASVNRDTVNRLTPETASLVFEETLPRGEKPLQVFRTDDTVRSVHGASYTRLDNTELLSVVREFATDFVPPQESGRPGTEGGNGLYCGEQDMFCFLIDPTGWTEIGGEAFALGFFLWNSEVGKRSVGVQTFWFQAVCANHIVWDAVQVVEFSRKHTAKVRDAVGEIRRIIERLVDQRDSRRDGFSNAIEKAMRTRLGDDADDALKVLGKHGITQGLAKQAVEAARIQGSLTVFSIVDALTKMAGQKSFAGDRADIDQRASSLLNLVIA